MISNFSHFGWDFDPQTAEWIICVKYSMWFRKVLFSNLFWSTLGIVFMDTMILIFWYGRTDPVNGMTYFSEQN